MATLKHSSYEQPRKLSDILVYEIDPRWSREGGDFAPTSLPVPMGAVLCMDSECHYVPFGTELTPAQEAAEGVEAKDAVIADEPCAILVSKEMEISEEVQPCVVLKRGACVASANLYWLDSVSDEQKTKALSELAALGIVPKE